MAVSVAETPDMIRQEWLREASESKLSMKCRKRLDDFRRGWHFLRDQLEGNPEACPSGIRHKGGAKLNQALVRNVRTYSPMPRERSQAAQTTRIVRNFARRSGLKLTASHEKPRTTSSLRQG
jgi:hypothetical protein